MGENGNTSLQCLTEYRLSDKERALLEVLLNPEHRTKSITDICKVAGISRPTYYSVMEKPEFKAIYEDKTKDLIKQAIGPVVNTFVREALRGSFQHGKVILEMAGLYSEKTTIEHTGEVTLTADDRRQRIAELLQKAIPEAIPADYKVVPDQDNTVP